MLLFVQDNRSAGYRAASLAVAVASLVVLISACPAFAATAKAKPAAKNSANETKGQGQVSGADGQFGTIYSMKNGFNEEILSAKYSIDPVVSYGGYQSPNADEKLLVLDVAMKNASPTDQWSGGWEMTAVDQSGAQYNVAATALVSGGMSEFSHTLKPGQGLGQPAMHDPLQVVFKIPDKARVVKLITNVGRLNKNEDVLRFYIAGATAAEAGEAGDPKNIVAPLPDKVRDTSDPSGAIALDIGKGGKPGDGVLCPTNEYGMTLDSFGDAPSGTQIDGNPPDDGKKFVVATVTLHNLVKQDGSMWDTYGNGKIQVIDADGDPYDITAKVKAGSFDAINDDHKIQPGEQYTYRFVFTLPSSATPKRFTYQADTGRIWGFDL